MDVVDDHDDPKVPASERHKKAQYEPDDLRVFILEIILPAGTGSHLGTIELDEVPPVG